MSESGDDFGGFPEPTPNRAKPVAASAKPGSSRTQAGPSKAAGGGTAARRKAAATEDSGTEEAQPPPAKKAKAGARGRKQQEQDPEVEEDEVVDQLADDVEVDDGEIEEIEPSRPKMKGRPASKKIATQTTGVVNGHAGTTLASAAAKGKGKAKGKTRRPSAEEVDVDLVEISEEPMDVDDAEEVAGPAKPTGRGTKNARPLQRLPPKQDAEIARLKEALEQANNHIADMKRQLAEINQVRYTEPEQLLERLEAQHTAQTRAQDNLIEDLKAKLAQNDPLLKSGKKAVFELLTREEANREMEKLTNQLKAYKDVVVERDRTLKERDEQIQTLEQEKSDLKYELKLEIDRSKELASRAQRPPGSVQRSNGGMLASHQDPKIGEVVKFYEDLTNLLVPSIKVQPGRYLKTDECILACCYTYKDVTKPEVLPKSIYFTLRLCHDLTPGSSEPVAALDQLVESVHYLPHDLDKEDPEFVRSLGFLGDTFTFKRDQLSLFLRTLYEYVSGEGDDSKEEDAGSDEDSSVVLVQ